MMTNTEKILHALDSADAILCDDCISQIASVYPRQQVNAIAGALFTAGRIYRRDGLLCGSCGRHKKGSVRLGLMPSSYNLDSPAKEPSRLVLRQQIAPSQRPWHDDGNSIAVNLNRPWHWEGNVQIFLRDFLVREGWSITHFADTESKESGIDLGATKGSRTILFEVKGYPTTVYDYGPNRGQAKPTPPNSQARQWFSHALLGVMRIKEKHPDKEVALCFPDFPTYRKLVESTRSSLQILAVAIYLINNEGEISVLLGQ